MDFKIRKRPESDGHKFSPKIIEFGEKKFNRFIFNFLWCFYVPIIAFVLIYEQIFSSLPSQTYLIIFTLVVLSIVWFFLKGECPRCKNRYRAKFTYLINPKCISCDLPFKTNKGFINVVKSKSFRKTQFKILITCVLFGVLFPPVSLMYLSATDPNLDKRIKRDNNIFNAIEKKGESYTLTERFIYDSSRTKLPMKIRLIEAAENADGEVLLVLYDFSENPDIGAYLKENKIVSCIVDKAVETDDGIKDIKYCVPKAYLENPKQFRSQNSKFTIMLQMAKFSLYDIWMSDSSKK